MPRVLIRTLGAVVAVAAIMAPTAAAAGGDEQPSRRFCSQFVEFNALLETVDRVRTVAGEVIGDAADDDEAFVLVALSAPLADVAARLARTGPRTARADLRDAADAYAEGDTILEDAGVTGDLIDALPGDVAALTDVVAGEPVPDLNEVVDGLGIQDLVAFFAAARQLADSAGAAENSARRALPDDVEERCGAAPSGEYVCDDLVSDDDAEAVLGTIDETAAGGGCAWGADDEVLAVEVYANGAASFDLLEARLFEAEPVADVGDDAAVGRGYTSTASGQGGTSGMTLVVRDGRRTVLVSLSLDDTTPEQLTGLAQQALDNL